MMLIRISLSRNIYLMSRNFKKFNARHKIEEKYQRKSLQEHILHRPDSYVGSLSRGLRSTWIYDEALNKIVKKDILLSPALFKIFDEILVNALDNKIRDKETSYIKINIDKEANTIKISNDGTGIPVIIHSQEGIYIPNLIFGHLLTSSNYDDSLDKYTGGRNGFGAKLCNLFSKEFTVETSNSEFGYSFKQTWRDNMTTSTEPIVEPATSPDFTTVTFSPDLSRFDMECFDADIISLFHKRAFDIASCIANLSVYFNDSIVPVNSFKEYAELYQWNEVDQKVVYKKFDNKWEVAVTVSSNDAFNQISFVNGVNTSLGGSHVTLFTEKLITKLLELAKKQMQPSIEHIKPQQLRNCLSIFINCFIKNPTYESQSKELLTLLPRQFGTTLTISDEFVRKVADSGVFKKLKEIIDLKNTELQQKVSGRKLSTLNDIAKLDDAVYAGTSRSKNCTLILTEGDSAKALALSGLSVMGKDYYGVYPLKGKLLNVSKVQESRTARNIEYTKLVKILGLNYKRKYTSEESLQTLRYGRIMIMADQDPDGSHIKGLIINFIHRYWPELLTQHFIEQFITPLLKAFKGETVKIFFSEDEFEQWQQTIPDAKSWRIKYYKGLGTSTSSEAKEYFSNIDRHRIPFTSSEFDSVKLQIAFEKKLTEQRKIWLTDWMERRKDNKRSGLTEENIYDEAVKSMTYCDFVDKELVHYFNADNVRSIPSLMDGLKPSQRKILYTCFKRNLKKEIKVAQLAGSVAELSSYHHGELTLNETIIGLAQDFVGSNNINLLTPIGQFGTRVYGGKDNASARYIYTQLSPLTRLIFNPLDDPLLNYHIDNDQVIEPEWYAPIIPMILVNGCEGIGTGWKSIIPCYNPLDVIGNVKRLLQDEEPMSMEPWFRNFTGEIKEISPGQYHTYGRIEAIKRNKFVISELALKQWTHTFREKVLKRISIGANKLLKEYHDHSTDKEVKIILHLNPLKIQKAMSVGLGRIFKLRSVIRTDGMILFDHNGRIRKYESAVDVLKNFYQVRLPIYDQRKSYMERKLEAKYRKFANQHRFLVENLRGVISLKDITEMELNDLLLRNNYDSDPMKEWDEEEGNESEFDFEYLIGQRLRSLTVDNVQNLENQKLASLKELSIVRSKSAKEMWMDDLCDLEENLSMGLGC